MILDGGFIAKHKLSELKKKCTSLPSKPRITFIRVGNDPASKIYVNLKAHNANAVGIDSHTEVLPESASEESVIACIHKHNNDNQTHAILVQLPLPKHINTCTVINAIDSRKDVDGLTDLNMGRLLRNAAFFTPCTPKGIISILDHYHIPIARQQVVIVGRSRIVGKPLSYCLTNRDATVTLCHQQTLNLKNLISQADIVVSATGKKDIIKGSWLHSESILIDVGIHRSASGIGGDVDIAEYRDQIKAYTPVPGGVGPMTVCSLLENTLLAYQS